MDILTTLLTYVVPFLFILSVVVFVHEFGHFFVARMNGVKVDVFSIGFGREIVGFNDRHGTRWKISLLPFGGYVKFFGDADAASGSTDGRTMTEEEKRVSFHHKRLGQKAAIVFAGPAANFVFAILVFAGIFMTIGQPTTPAVLGEVVPDSAAAAAGLQPGDRVLSVEGKRVERFEDIQRIVPLYGAEPMEVVIERDGTVMTLRTEPRMQEITDPFGNPQVVPVLGVRADSTAREIVKYGPLEAVGVASVYTWEVTTSALKYLGQMITGVRGTEDLGGPLRIAEMSGQAAQFGFITVIMFAATLSVNLGLINLFPIPLLDGGHLLFYGLEALRGRPLGERAQEMGLRLGLILVFGIMIFATWNDILRLVTS